MLLNWCRSFLSKDVQSLHWTRTVREIENGKTMRGHTRAEPFPSDQVHRSLSYFYVFTFRSHTYKPSQAGLYNFSVLIGVYQRWSMSWQKREAFGNRNFTTTGESLKRFQDQFKMLKQSADDLILLCSWLPHP